MIMGKKGRKGKRYDCVACKKEISDLKYQLSCVQCNALYHQLQPHCYQVNLPPKKPSEQQIIRWKAHWKCKHCQDLEDPQPSTAADAATTVTTSAAAKTTTAATVTTSAAKTSAAVVAKAIAAATVTTSAATKITTVDAKATTAADKVATAKATTAAVVAAVPSPYKKAGAPVAAAVQPAKILSSKPATTNGEVPPSPLVNSSKPAQEKPSVVICTKDAQIPSSSKSTPAKTQKDVPDENVKEDQVTGDTGTGTVSTDSEENVLKKEILNEMLGMFKDMRRMLNGDGVTQLGGDAKKFTSGKREVSLHELGLELVKKHFVLPLKRENELAALMANRIVVTGLPNLDGNLSPVELALTIAEKLDVQLDEKEINACHVNKQNQSLVIDLVRNMKKVELMGQSKNLELTDEAFGGNTKQRVYLNEDLTPVNYKLYQQAMKALQPYDYSIWKVDGKIKARKGPREMNLKSVTIRNRADLNKIIKKEMKSEKSQKLASASKSTDEGVLMGDASSSLNGKLPDSDVQTISVADDEATRKSLPSMIFHQYSSDTMKDVSEFSDEASPVMEEKSILGMLID